MAQGHQLHGAARDEDRWRRTLVAELAGQVVGAVTVARNRVHPGRYSLAVEVAAQHRGHGLGRSLVEHARRLPSTPLPFAAKVRPSDVPALALLRRLGGRIYQRCPGLCPDPTAPEVLAWARRSAHSSGTQVTPLTDVPRSAWPELWVQQYLWVHEEWSPAAEEPLRQLTDEVIADVDPQLSSVAFGDSRDGAICWVFAEGGGRAGVVAETIRRHTSTGIADVAAVLARSLTLLNEQGCRTVEIDGHVTDPHLTRVLEAFPDVAREPLYLVEVPPVPIERG